MVWPRNAEDIGRWVGRPREHVRLALDLDDALVAEIGAKGVVTDAEIGRVSLTGAGMQTNPGVAATMFETLSTSGINIEMISTSAIRISCVVREDRAEAAVAALHEAYQLDRAPEDRTDV